SRHLESMAHGLVHLHLQTIVERGIPKERGGQTAPALINYRARTKPRTIVTVSTGEWNYGVPACRRLIAREVIRAADKLRQHLIHVVHLGGAVKSVRSYIAN